MKRNVILPLATVAVLGTFSQTVLSATIQEMLAERRAQQAELIKMSGLDSKSIRANVAASAGEEKKTDEEIRREKEEPKTVALEKAGVDGANFDLYVAQNGLPEILDDNEYAMAKRDEETIAKNSGKAKTKTIIITDNGLPVPVELTVGEFEFLQAKKETISQYLYENYELEEVRNLLREYHRREQFSKYMDEEIPLTAEEIMEYRVAKQREQIALNTRLDPISHHIRTTDVNVESPNPITIFVTKGLASSLVFFDSTGAPWPVEGEVIGDSNSYSSNIMTKNKNVVTFNIQREFSETNALITLEGIPTPLVFKLVSNGKDNDDRLSARLPIPGPNANVKLYMEQQFENKDPYMVELMNNHTVDFGKEYKLVGVNGKVFVNDDKMYVKTFEKLVSPAWTRQLQSTTGYNLYELKPSTKLLFNIDGNIVQAKVEGIDFFMIKNKVKTFK